jgi:hypothetical protein
MCHIFEEIWSNRVIDTISQVIDMLFSRPYIYASLRLKFQISTCERAYSLRAVWPAEEVDILMYSNITNRWNTCLPVRRPKQLKVGYSPYVNKAFVYISVFKILNFIRQLFIFSCFYSIMIYQDTTVRLCNNINWNKNLIYLI